jgi:hypothetical protein
MQHEIKGRLRAPFFFCAALLRKKCSMAMGRKENPALPEVFDIFT